MVNSQGQVVATIFGEGAGTGDVGYGIPSSIVEEVIDEAQRRKALAATAPSIVPAGRMNDRYASPPVFFSSVSGSPVSLGISFPSSDFASLPEGAGRTENAARQ